MNRTAIETCQLTWNPLTGCKRDCFALYGFHCYARAGFAFRKRDFTPMYHEDRLWEPTERATPSLIMGCSVADPFGPWVPKWQTQRLLWVASCASWHVFQFFTKTPERLAQFSPFPPNVWIIVSVPAQKALGPALDALAEIKAAVRGISFEPLMEQILVHPHRGSGGSIDRARRRLGQAALPIDWAILGGLSGRKERSKGAVYTQRQAWADYLYGALAVFNVPTFVKGNLAMPHLPPRWPHGWDGHPGIPPAPRQRP